MTAYLTDNLYIYNCCLNKPGYPFIMPILTRHNVPQTNYQPGYAREPDKMNTFHPHDGHVLLV